jgi:hypothetical protein
VLSCGSAVGLRPLYQHRSAHLFTPIICDVCTTELSLVMQDRPAGDGGGVYQLPGRKTKCAARASGWPSRVAGCVNKAKNCFWELEHTFVGHVSSSLDLRGRGGCPRGARQEHGKSAAFDILPEKGNHLYPPRTIWEVGKNRVNDMLHTIGLVFLSTQVG